MRTLGLISRWTGGLVALLLASCGMAPQGCEAPARTSEVEAPATTAVVWPSDLPVLGDGFPNRGDPCRRLGESGRTVNFLDDSAQLVGCPGAATDPAAAAIVTGLGGRVVSDAEGFTLISVPRGDGAKGKGP